MSGFIALVVVLTALALLCVLPTLLRREADDGAAAHAHDLNLAVLRDQARELEADVRSGTLASELREQARDDLALRVASETPASAAPARGAPQIWTALVLAMAVPALAALVYQQVGNPAALTLVEQAARPAEGSHQTGAREIAGMVQGLAERLRREPGDVEGWQMLARSYTVLGRYHDAAAAYARLARLRPDDADVLADYADALATANGASVQGEPAALIERALARDPTHVKALALAGSAAFEAKQYARAVEHWQAVLKQAPADSEFAAATRASIAEARLRLDGGALAPTTAPNTAPERAPAAMPAAPATAALPAGDQAALVTGTVTLSQALAGRARAEDTVFVYARIPDGPPMPLAVVRARVSDLPLRFALSDADSMAGARLSDHKRVELVARVSRSGGATPAPGDLEASSGAVTLPARDLALDIQHIRR